MSTALLARRHFLPLFVTQFLGAFNDNVFKNALVILITFQAASCADSPILVTVAAGLFIVPFFLFSATAGQFADKVDKARVIRLIKLGEIAIMLVGALGFFLRSVELLMVVLFAMGAQSAFFGPVKYGILPQHLEEDALMGANALIQGSTFVAILVGTVAGGLLISIPDAGGSLTAACVIVLAVVGWATSRTIPDAPAADPQLILDRNPFRQTWRVAVMAAENRDVMVAVVGISWFWFVGATFLQLFPGFTCDTLGGGPSVVLLLLCTFTIGVAGGSWISAQLSGGRVSLALAPLGAFGLFAFALVPVIFPPAAPDASALSIFQVLANAGNWPTLLALLGLAVSGGVFVVPMFAFVQRESPPERRARVIAAANVLNALFMVMSALMTIVLLKSGMKITGVFAVTGIGTLFVLIGMLAASTTMRKAFAGRFFGHSC
ncbi:MAG: MFS family permease [Gammaproteobacteria bacterium]